MTPFLRARRQTYTPLMTPFNEGRVDLAELEAAIDRQIIAGVDGIVVCDVIGEGPVLSSDECESLLKAAVFCGRPHLSVIAATGTNCTARTVERCRRAEELGADALLVTVPYYSKPTLKGVVDHFRDIAAAVGIPVLVDDDPGRTAKDYGSALVEALAEVDLVAGLCHGVGRLDHFAALPASLRDRFMHLSRDDRRLMEFLDLGGHGGLSALANIIPSPVQTMVAMAEHGSNCSSLLQAMSVASTSVGVDDVAALKEAQFFLHQSPADVRLPLVAAEAETILRVRHGFAPFARCEPSTRQAA
jgi:4-hydroxy-tetrahydrodipicolinate synthase